MCFVLIEPNAPPANVQGHNTSSTSIWVDWDAVPIADQNGIILTYTVTYSSLPGGISQTAVINASSTHVTLKGLKKYTNYSIFVFASTAKGDGNASDPITVTTDEDSKLLKALKCLTMQISKVSFHKLYQCCIIWENFLTMYVEAKSVQEQILYNLIVSF